LAWNKDKLSVLKEKFDGTNANTIYDPRFKKIADKIYSEGRRPMPFAGIPTLLDAPYHPIDKDNPDYQDLQVALYGMPMDLGVTNRAGARFGPRALRAIERIGPYHDVLDCAPIHEMNVADIGDVPFASRYDLHQSLDDIEKFIGHMKSAGVIPVGVGGDHSVTHPIMKVLGQDEPVGLIHIDAHCDTSGPTEGEKFHHGGPFRNAVLDGVLDPERTIQIGIRGSAEYIWEFSTESGMTVIQAKDISDMGIAAIIEKTWQVIGDGPTYFSFDVDGLDPVYAPGTGTPEAGGLSMREAMAIIRGMKGANFIGGDVVEVAPSYDATTNTAQNGAQLLFDILSLMMFSPSLRKL
jgi:agmatinase